MKKLAATVATGILFAGVTVSNVSAEEIEVHKGDTLWGVSREHNITVEELMDINKLKSTTIHPDQKLVISEIEQYTVKKGDTLSGIGNESGVSVQNLKEANGLKSDLITTGQILKVKGGNAEQAADPEIEEPTEEVEISETDEEAAEQAKAEEEAAEQAKADEEAAEQAKADEEAAEQAKAEEEAAERAKAEEEAAEQAKAEEEAAEQAKAEEEEQAEKTTTQVTTTEQTTAEPTPAKQETNSEKQAEGESITVSATAYTATCDGCTGVTATGVDLNANPNAKVIAVDPSVIPLGSKVYVEGYGYATAADTGGAIQGNKIDVHVPNKNQAYGWGVKTVNVTVVE